MVTDRIVESADDSATKPKPSARGLLAGLALATLLSSLGTSIANVALPTLTVAFTASFAAVQWIVLAYLLTITALIVSVGRLGDVFGRGRLLQLGIVIFTIASALAGLAPTLGLLIAARAAQGLGAAIMMALALVFAGESVPKNRIGSAMGLLGTMSALGTALGPTLGGMLIATFGWPSIFLVNVPLGLATLHLARRHLPSDHPTPGMTRPAFDHAGTLLLATMLGAYALAMTIGHGHPGPLNLGLLMAAAISAGLFVQAERRAPAPLIQIAVFREPGLTRSLATSTMVATVIMSTLVVGPFYLSQCLGLEAGAVGLAMSVGPLVAALTGLPAGRMVDRFGARRAALSGLAGMTVAAAALSLVPTRAGIVGYVLPMGLLTAGYALFQAANTTAVMANSGPEQRGVVSGLLNLSRNIGLITGASAMGAVFALASRAVDIAKAAPQDIARGMHVTFGVAVLIVLATLAVAEGGRVREQHQAQAPAA